MNRAYQPHVDDVARPAFVILQGSRLLVESPQLVSIILSCADNENLVQGRHAHAYIVSHDFHMDFRVGNALIHMYGKCGVAADAQKVFDTMSVRNLISWNNIIAVYAHTGPSKKALELFERMRLDEFIPNRISILMVIFACASHESLCEGKQIHGHISGSAYEGDVVVRTALINMYGKCGSVEDARLTFVGSPDLDVVTWNAIMSVYVQHGLGREALRLFVQMQQQGELPNKVSLVSVLSACANHAEVARGKQLHTHITGSGLQNDLVVGNALINMYGKCGNAEGAWCTFDSMYDRDIISWNAVISAYARSEATNMAFQVFWEMHQEGFLPNKVTLVISLDVCSKPNVLLRGKHLHASLVTCGFKSNVIVRNALVNMYGMCGKLLDALKVFDEMPVHNTINLLTIVSACINQEAVREGALVHAYIIDNGLKIDVMLGNALVNLYSKCGRLQDARKVFDTMQEKNVVSWTTIIAAYSQHGHGRDAIALFEQMQKGMVKPNTVTFVTLLAACSHAGLVEEGHLYFRSMTQKYGIEPTLDHYHCMIDLLGRSGRLNDAEEMLNSMPFKATATSWMILLSACKKEADINLAERATNRIMDLDPGSAAPYVMLSHVYVSAGREDLVFLIPQESMSSSFEMNSGKSVAGYSQISRWLPKSQGRSRKQVPRRRPRLFKRKIPK